MSLIGVSLAGPVRSADAEAFPGSVLILVILLLTIRWIGAGSVKELLAVGLLWLGLTLTFEISLGYFVFHYSWGRVLSDYNILEGGLLPVGLLVMTLAPLVSAKARRLI